MIINNKNILYVNKEHYFHQWNEETWFLTTNINFSNPHPLLIWQHYYNLLHIINMQPIFGGKLILLCFACVGISVYLVKIFSNLEFKGCSWPFEIEYKANTWHYMNGWYVQIWGSVLDQVTTIMNRLATVSMNV